MIKENYENASQDCMFVVVYLLILKIINLIMWLLVKIIRMIFDASMWIVFQIFQMK